MAKKRATRKKVTAKKPAAEPAHIYDRLRDPLLFVDTNILLDFYRARTPQQLSLLDRIDSVRDKIICTYQVEMEFKKNRQKSIAESLKAMKCDTVIKVPAYLDNNRSVRSARGNLQTASHSLELARKTLERALHNPTSHDPVYKVVQRLFQCNTEINLTRDNNIRYRIRRLAWKRFILGYPPRKANDTSTGDAINWEWIVNCAMARNCDVIVVSRDSDFGINVSKKSYINDWLAQEFKQRVGKHHKILLTPRLTDGLQILQQQVTKKELQGEEELIGRSGATRGDKYEDLLRSFMANIQDTDFYLKLSKPPHEQGSAES